jgi:hypothetical protein
LEAADRRWVVIHGWDSPRESVDPGLEKATPPTKGRLACLAVRATRRKSSTTPRPAIDQQLSAYTTLVETIDEATSDPKVASALEAFEPLLFNNMILVLDRYFVHRVRMVTGKDGNALNEVELMSESLMDNDGVLRGNNVIKLVPDRSVLKLDIGDRIRLSAAQFERLSKAFFGEIQAKFL